MIRVAIVGSRDFPNLKAVRDLVKSLGNDVEIVSGGARGVDRTAVEAAKRLGLPYIEFIAEWSLFGKAAGWMRNQKLVDYADTMYAFWDGQSRGTLDAITRMRRRKRPVIVVTDPPQYGCVRFDTPQPEPHE